MDKDNYLKRCRGESFILTPGKVGPLMKFMDLNSREDIDRNLVRIEGSTTQPGKYYIPGRDIWEVAVIPALEMKLEELKRRFESFCQQRVNEGYLRPDKWPVELAEEKAKIEARLTIAMEEVAFLRKTRKQAPIPKEELEEIKRRRHWGSGRLRNGFLVELGGFRITPNTDGILRIDDPRSEHDGMEAWRFRSQIFKPMAWEHSYRDNLERKAAETEKRPYKEPPYPEAGIWHKKKDAIEYPGYSEHTLKQIKKLQQD